MLDTLVQQIVNTLVLGGIYAALAVGLILIFGTMRLIQFAHGEVCILGGFAALGVLNLWSYLHIGGAPWLPLLFGFGVAIFVGAGLGWTLERTAFRPLQARSPVLTLVVSLGLAMVIRETLAVLWPNGRNPQPFLPSLSELVVSFRGVTFSPVTVAVAIAGFVMVWLAHQFVRHTEIGLATRAIAQDYEAAFMVGIPVRKIQSRTFMFASVLAASAGCMVGIAYGSIRYDLGLTLVLKAFTAAVLGGMTSVLGAAIGGLALASVETLVVALVPNGSTYRDTVAFAVLTVALVVRPEGLALLRNNR
jgi:branched-chain amino acid transport system permease protein